MPEERDEQLRHSLFPSPAKGKTGEGDPELCRGQQQVNVTLEDLDASGLLVAGFHQAIDLRSTYRDHGEFCGDKEGVNRN